MQIAIMIAYGIFVFVKDEPWSIGRHFAMAILISIIYMIVLRRPTGPRKREEKENDKLVQ